MSNQDYLAHYASKYYDPVKAHEYYMRTRELKGRRSSSKLDDEGKKVWAYTKSQITDEKKEAVQEEQRLRNTEIEELRENAKQCRERITQKLKQLNEALSSKLSQTKESIEADKDRQLQSISEDAQAKREQIEEERDRKIKQLMSKPIPEGLPKEQRQKLIAERNEEVAKLREDADLSKHKVNVDASSNKDSTLASAASNKQAAAQKTKDDKAANTASAKEEREQVASELKSAIAAAREAYKVAKTNVDASYETIYQQEYDKILSKYQKPTKK